MQHYDNPMCSVEREVIITRMANGWAVTLPRKVQATAEFWGARGNRLF